MITDSCKELMEGVSSVGAVSLWFGAEEAGRIDLIFTVFHFLSSREGKYVYKQGTTPVLTKTVTPLTLDLVEETVQMMDSQ